MDQTEVGISPSHSQRTWPPMVQHPRHPLGPLIVERRLMSPRRDRCLAAMVLVVAVAVLGIAVWLSPAVDGVGTHEQLGLAPCTMMMVSGVPCPTCGMTTAFSHTVRGQWVSALVVQPMGFLLALCTLLAAGISAYALLRGRFWILNLHRVRPPWIAFGSVGLLLLSWVYKIFAMRQGLG